MHEWFHAVNEYLNTASFIALRQFYYVDIIFLCNLSPPLPFLVILKLVMSVTAFVVRSKPLTDEVEATRDEKRSTIVIKNYHDLKTFLKMLVENWKQHLENRNFTDSLVSFLSACFFCFYCFAV